VNEGHLYLINFMGLSGENMGLFQNSIISDTSKTSRIVELWLVDEAAAIIYRCGIRAIPLHVPPDVPLGGLALFANNINLWLE